MIAVSQMFRLIEWAEPQSTLSQHFYRDMKQPSSILEVTPLTGYQVQLTNWFQRDQIYEVM